MVDTTDTARMEEAGAELRGLLESLDTERTPVLVMGNKAEHPRAVSQTVLVQQLGIHQVRPEHILHFQFGNSADRRTI